MKTSGGLRIANVLGVLIFAAFAWFQRNDIDPEIYYHPSELDAVLWLMFYALIAVCFVIAVLRHPVPRWMLGIAALGALIFMGLTIPGIWENFFGEREFTMTQTSMSAEDPRVELSREFFGALIALVALGFLYWQRPKNPRADDA